ncbi:MAG: septum formation protein Maf [PVC group bacterium]|nr:septum formation protein Maf [PVC group bacterium]
MKTVILASRSPRRIQLLKKLGITCKVIPSNISESLKNHHSPAQYALLLALAKAEAVAKNLKQGLVIGADTIVVFQNKIFGKPKNHADAKHILSTLSNTVHHVYTAIAVVNAKTGKRIVDIDKSTIFARKLTSSQITMLAQKNHDKAGAYAVQDSNDILVKKIVGDYYNVVGLPLDKLKNILRIFN